MRRLLLSLLVFPLAACSATTDTTPSSTPAPSASEPAAAATPTAGVDTATPSSSPSPAQPRIEELATGLDVPWAVAPIGDGAALVTLRDRGEVVKVAPGGVNTPVARIEGVDAGGEGGLLGLAVSPEDPAEVFVYYTAARDNRIERMRFDGTSLTPDRVIVDGIPKGNIHNGGRLAFGPDGYLYVGTGESGDKPISQQPENLGGKILRVDRDGNPAPGNPFGTRIWTTGHRNVQGLAWDDQGRMYASEFGQNTWDELNLIEPGKNYGWPTVEGRGGDPRFTDPLQVWKPADASPSGLAYLNGNLWMAALRGESLWRIPVGGGEPERLFAQEYGRLRDAKATEDGRLYVVTSNTFRGTPKPGDDRILIFRP